MDNRTQIGIANSIWVNQDYAVLPTFADINRDMYDATVQNLDFGNAGAVDIINGWCNEHTQGMIPQIIKEVKETNLVYLLNALYFKGYWKTQFKKENTRIEAFHNLDYTQTRMPLMHLGGESWRYSGNEYFDIAWLPYGNEAFNLVILLPTEEKEGEERDRKWEECLAQLTAENWRTWLDDSYVQPMDLKLPRFSLRYERNLIDDMQALGIKDAFDSENADFSLLSDTPLYLSLLKQIATLDVDEEGTKAAAVTVGGGGEASVGPGGAFYVDRPFVFMITEYSTGNILFIGRVTKF